MTSQNVCDASAPLWGHSGLLPGSACCQDREKVARLQAGDVVEQGSLVEYPGLAGDQVLDRVQVEPPPTG